MMELVGRKEPLAQKGEVGLAKMEKKLQKKCWKIESVLIVKRLE